MKILVADKLADEGLEVLRVSGASYDIKIGLSESALAAELARGQYDALVVRSGAKVTAAVLQSPGRLNPSVVLFAGSGCHPLHVINNVFAQFASSLCASPLMWNDSTNR